MTLNLAFTQVILLFHPPCPLSIQIKAENAIAKFTIAFRLWLK